MKNSFEKINKKEIKSLSLPCYLYDEKIIQQQIKKCKSFQSPFGLTICYAMKANSNVSILNLFHKENLSFDASSFYEVQRAIKGRIPADKILLSSQQVPDFQQLKKAKIRFNACSLHQLEQYGKSIPNTKLGVRINPGFGSGGNDKTNVGGVNSSFGIWHEYIPKIKEIAKKYNLTIHRIHTHIGSGSDPRIWQKVAKKSIALLHFFPQAKILNLGGGYKISRNEKDKDADLTTISKCINKELKNFYHQTKRKIHLEIEPGTYLIAKAGFLVAQIEDIVDTGQNGNSFIKLNTGMNDFLRTSLYEENHLISHIAIKKNDSKKSKEYFLVGHCCESGDTFTIGKKKKLQNPQIGDIVVVHDCGAYCSSMSAKNYNSFPEINEFLKIGKEIKLIKKQQNLKQILANEINIY